MTHRGEGLDPTMFSCCFNVLPDVLEPRGDTLQGVLYKRSVLQETGRKPAFLPKNNAKVASEPKELRRTNERYTTQEKLSNQKFTLSFGYH